MNKKAYTKYFWLVNTAGGKLLSVCVAVAMVFSLTSIAFAIDEAIEALAGSNAEAPAAEDADTTDATNGEEALDAADVDGAADAQEAAQEAAEDTATVDAAAEDEGISFIEHEPITGVPITEGTVIEEGELEPNPIYGAPTIVLNDTTRAYNGAPLAETTYTVEGLQDGDELQVFGFVGSQTDVGSSTISVESYKIWRGEDQVDYLYLPAAVQDATITVEPAPLNVFTPSASKEYDGEALVYTGDWNFGDEASAETLWGNDEVEFEVTGSQTEVGSSPNGYRLTWVSGNPNNYTIVEDLGTLTVLPAAEAVYVIAPSASKIYDGTPLVAEGLEWTGLPDGYTVQASVQGSVTNAGTAASSVDAASVRILDDAGTDVTQRYNVETIPGELVVEQATLSVLTEGADKVDDGTPLTAPGHLGGLVEGESATIVTTGVQNGVGNSINTYRIEWGNATDPANYQIVEELGILNIDAAPAPAVQPEPAAPAPNNAGNGSGGNAGNDVAPAPEAAPVQEVVVYEEAPVYYEPAVASYAPAAPAAPAANTSAVPDSAATNAATDSDAADTDAAETSTGINPVVEALATGMQNLEQVATGEEPTDLIAPNVRTSEEDAANALAEGAEEEVILDDENPLGVFDEPVDCWVHWYTLLGLIATLVYGVVVMFFRRAYTYELESREANLLGTRVGLARPRTTAQGSKAGKEA